MKFILIHIILFAGLNAFAQKEDLRRLGSKLINTLDAAANLHLDYTLFITGNDDTLDTDTMKISFYKKSGQEFKMQIGTYQTLIRDKQNMLKVDHINKVILYELDTTSVSNDPMMLKQLLGFIDSARSIQFNKKNKMLMYDLAYNEKAPFKSIELSFASGDELLSTFYARYNIRKGQPYHTMKLSYDLWDFNWKEKNNEFNIGQFIETRNGQYQPVQAYSNYKLISNIKNK